ncbi:hypothetical protein [Rhizobium sp. Leaf262]|uniref:hypothetical protein n=1 Tax=Rhizobium sp. Leaf262 TaxID=1736312 RepID=UPI0007136E4F|nr:hypothetical protein [Rhizobium sp. Leaf262]KQO81011.1 hypothetical protein ASF29_19640 [Rhizobium sp. Leaf262]
MHHSLKRLGIVLLASLALMSFRLEPEAGDGGKLLYDVRGAFVAAKPDVSPELMQSIHYHMSNAIKSTTRDQTRPRVVLTIRLLAVTKGSLILGERASARVVVRAAAVQTGEVVAETSFTATVLGIDKSMIDQELATGIVERVVSEFSLDRPSPLATALFPGKF